MSSESLSYWDRKDFFKERKHERSESLCGSVARWRDSSSSSSMYHHNNRPRKFAIWGSTELRRPPSADENGVMMINSSNKSISKRDHHEAFEGDSTDEHAKKLKFQIKKVRAGGAGRVVPHNNKSAASLTRTAAGFGSLVCFFIVLAFF